MKSKRTYRAEEVEQVEVATLLRLLMTGCVVAVDVAKAKFVVALASLAGEVIKFMRFEHPTGTRRFLALVDELRRALPRVVVGMEPTGTYGDAVRYQLVRGGALVQMVSPKRTHDLREAFDGVPSMHDPKSAMIIAKVCAMGLGRPWTPPCETSVRLRALVEARQHESERRERCFGRIEALLARHWPEFQRWLDVREQKAARALLVSFPVPALVDAAPDEARALLESASHKRLSKETLDGVLADARTSLGVPALEEEASLLARLAREAREATTCIEEIERDIARVGAADAVFARLAPWMGAVTAAVLVAFVNPTDYASTRAFEKACGLNLRETSSGEHKGRLSITKRGPGRVRQMLYLFALRMIQSSPETRAWYGRRQGHREDSKRRAVVAVVRKLVKATFHVARGATFDATKLFDTRRLDLAATTTTTAAAPTPRSAPRSIARGSKKRGGSTANAST